MAIIYVTKLFTCPIWSLTVKGKEDVINAEKDDNDDQDNDDDHNDNDHDDDDHHHHDDDMIRMMEVNSGIQLLQV